MPHGSALKKEGNIAFFSCSPLLGGRDPLTSARLRATLRFFWGSTAHDGFFERRRQ
jgi:hypothetical protein